MVLTEEEIRKRRERLGQFDHLMGTIDRWTDDTSGVQGSTFKHLREGALVKETVVTPRTSVSVARLKSFLAMEILKIYPWNSASNITWRDIRGYITGETKKQYNFYFGELDNCFDLKKNAEAALELRMLEAEGEEDNGNPLENPENWDSIPVYLLDILQKRFQDELGKYWQMCDNESDSRTASGKTKWKKKKSKEEDSEDNHKAKIDAYMNCVTSLALREIFVRDMLEKGAILTEEAEEQTERMDRIAGEIEQIGRQLDGAEGNEREELEGQMACWIRESVENIKWHQKFLNLQAASMEHLICLGADLQVIMLLEKGRLEEITLNMGNQDGIVGKYLAFMKERYLFCLESYNKNRKKYYDRLTANVQRAFANYAESVQQPGQGDVSEAVETYLQIVTCKKRSDAQKEEIWEKQNIIAGFLWREDREAG